MAHILVIGDQSPCASLRDQLVRSGHTVALAAPGTAEAAGLGVDACDVVVEVGEAAWLPGPGAVSDGGRGAAPAAPRFSLPEAVVATGLTAALRVELEAACRQARELRAQGAGEQVAGGQDPDVHEVGHELRSPLTVIKTALEVMEGDLRSCHVEPADIDSQLRMLEIALRNVRRLHRAVEWSQMLLAGPRAAGEPLTAAGPAPTGTPAPAAGGAAAALHAGSGAC